MALDVNDLKELKKAFRLKDHEFKQGYVYLTEDAITNRIEEVDAAWTFEIQRMDRIGDQTIVCARMTIKEVAREGVGMQNVTSNANAEPEKGAATDALKRCARLFGIGRYLLNAPKEGDEFNRWLAEQQKSLNGVTPESNGHITTDKPIAMPTGAGVNRPTPPPASPQASPAPNDVSVEPDPLAEFGMEAGATVTPMSDEDPRVHHCDILIVNRSKGVKQYALAIVNSRKRIAPVNPELLKDLHVGDALVKDLDPGNHDLIPSWSVYAEFTDAWHIDRIVTGMGDGNV